MALLLAVICTVASTDNSPQEAYIRKYADIAVSEMYRSGVPASITLAQGLLESRYGQSALASKGNNHFGIKCHDWTGKKMYYDDDKKGECFRVYSNAEESFKDHSDFLRYRDRYKSLFDNRITDYKSWAYGLKKAGYATDPTYPAKLIKLIEDYHLYDYDKMRPGDVAAFPVKTENFNGKSAKSGNSKGGTESSSRRKVKSKGRNPVVIPDSPLSIEEPRKVKFEGRSEKFSVCLSRQVYEMNGVKFIYAYDGETYGSIADKYNLFSKEILRFNDKASDCRLQAGEIVYIQAKKHSAAKGLEKYISDEGGESMWDLSQRFALKLKDLCDMNPSFRQNYVTQPGDELRLR